MRRNDVRERQILQLLLYYYVPGSKQIEIRIWVVLFVSYAVAAGVVYSEKIRLDVEVVEDWI